MLNVALRNVFRHRVRTAITLGAIVAGVVGLILSGGFVHDIFTQLGEAIIHSQTGHIQVSRAGFQRSGSRKPELYRIANPAQLKARIAAFAGVTDVMARVNFSGLLNNGRADVAIIGEGVEPEHESRLGTALVILSGRPLVAGDRNGVMVGSGVAQALQLHPGDRVILMANTDAGALNTLDMDVVGIFQTYSKDYDAHAVRIPLAAAQEILDSPDVNTLVVSLGRTSDTATIAAELRSSLAASGMEVSTWQELNDFYASTVRLYDSQFGVLRLIILLMVLLSVTNSVNMTLFERIAEFGTMRALGDSSGYVARLILTETFLLGVIGAAIGVVLGAVLCKAISAVGIPMPPPPNADLGYTARIALVPVVVRGAWLVGVVASTVAGIPAAWRVTRIPVVDALRYAI